jgi:hypothetical protein
VWTDTNIDKHSIIAHYTNKMYIDEIEIDSNETVIVFGGIEMVIKEDLNLLEFLNHKFER